MTTNEGRVLSGRYRLIRPVGHGAQASVWIADHLTLRTQVAVKLIDPELAKRADARERFRREATAAAQLRSAHVVQIIDHDIDNDQPFIAMELLEGEDLFERLDQRERLSLRETSRIITQIARALTRAHAAGIVHRDLKPENVFLVPNEDDEIAKVLDFGVAKIKDPTKQTMQRTRVGQLIGTPHYMSPEQVKGIVEVDYRTDLWALGVMAYQCVTGWLPFESEGVGDLLIKITLGELPVPSEVLPGLPATFDAWFAKACARDPEDRFDSARSMAKALATLVVAAPDLRGPALIPRPTGHARTRAIDESSERPSLPSVQAIPPPPPSASSPVSAKPAPQRPPAPPAPPAPAAKVASPFALAPSAPPPPIVEKPEPPKAARKPPPPRPRVESLPGEALDDDDLLDIDEPPLSPPPEIAPTKAPVVPVMAAPSPAAVTPEPAPPIDEPDEVEAELAEAEAPQAIALATPTPVALEPETTPADEAPIASFADWAAPPPSTPVAAPPASAPSAPQSLPHATLTALSASDMPPELDGSRKRRVVRVIGVIFAVLAVWIAWTAISTQLGSESATAPPTGPLPGPPATLTAAAPPEPAETTAPSASASSEPLEAVNPGQLTRPLPPAPPTKAPPKKTGTKAPAQAAAPKGNGDELEFVMPTAPPPEE